MSVSGKKSLAAATPAFEPASVDRMRRGGRSRYPAGRFPAWLTSLALLLLSVAQPGPFGGGAARAQGVVKGTFGDWELRCDTAPQPAALASNPQPQAPHEQCILYQNIADEKDDALSLRISVSKVFDPKNPGVRRPVLLVVSRLGVLLPRGLALRIDQTDIGSTGFVRCIPEGCVAQVDMDDALIEKFKKGKTATFIIALTPDEQRGLPLSLSGFEQGFAALQ